MKDHDPGGMSPATKAHAVAAAVTAAATPAVSMLLEGDGARG